MNILLTLKCNYRCGHCMFSCTGRGKHMGDDVFKQVCYIQSQVQTAPNIIGGEPTLAPEFDEKIITLAESANSDCIRVVTNGWFYSSGRVRRKFLKMVERLLSINDYISVDVRVSNDCFHREFWRYPDQATKVANWLRSGPESERLFLDDRNDDNRFYPVQPFGRGKDHYSGVASWYRIDCACNDATSDEEFDLDQAWQTSLVYPNGDVSPCCCAGGIMIGNVLKHSFQELNDRLERYLTYAREKHYRYSGEAAMRKCSRSCKRMNHKFDYRKER